MKFSDSDRSNTMDADHVRQIARNVLADTSDILITKANTKGFSHGAEL